MVNYAGAFKRPFTDLKKLVIGIVLSWIPIVNFLSLGYMLKCTKSATQKKFELPEWEDWVNLFVRGFAAFVIIVLYSIPLFVVSLALAMSVLTTMADALITGRIIEALLAIGSMVMVFSVILFLLLLFTLYILPSAIMLYARDDKFGSAFKFREVFKNAFKLNYLIAWVVWVLYAIVATVLLLGILLLILGINVLTVLLLSILPLIVHFTVIFVTGVTGMTLLAEVYPTAKKR